MLINRLKLSIFHNKLISKNYSLFMNNHRITNKEQTVELLKKNDIQFSVIDHEAVKTVQEGLEKVKNEQIKDFVFAKNLFLKTKDKALYLLTASPVTITITFRSPNSSSHSSNKL
jgi:hypothetical protein